MRLDDRLDTSDQWMQFPIRVLVAMLGLLVFMCAGGCGQAGSGNASPPATRTPGPDAAAARYRATIDADMRLIGRAYDRPTCTTRELCVQYLTQVKGATETLIADLNSVSPPPGLTVPAERVGMAAQRFLDDVNTAISAAGQPAGDYQSAAGRPNSHDVDLAVAELVCWPAQPVNAGGEGDYSCG
ncbi:MAG TPA: hypothetical protein VLK30_11255 [Candidatus Limnocylindrales bacterium]|nr:hypothetical protein [Candidatus Limnocylindrales bacterium]